MKDTFIDKRAVLGTNIRIGNNVVIEQDVTIGNNTQIGNNVTILSGSRIGENCEIHSNVVLGGAPQDLKYKGEYTLLEIGDKNIIREFVTINKGTISKGKTSIGNSNLIMSNAHIGHDCIIGNNCIIGFSVGMAGEVIVEDWVNISGLTAIHQFSVIGEHAMISGLSRVVKDVPPYVVVAHEPLRFAGVNTVGLRRRGFDSRNIDELRSIYRILFQERRNTKFALEVINNEFEKTEERDKILNFVRDSKRGIIKGFEF
ncbi:acyl-ACP--UDP-N-acetylglucosamine O-acyltransferase [Flavobacterium nitrogenifigens]|uniref:Acyl-[acyl-carrier-protein]--UDP-N-acetylglucosamine O-acyltransferase n=1 Tax=Flavobacterium nitrogenifigens TaxID=1617283 RepID=A0A521E8Y4_9FLAO|nr:acyl-ACP--UDP-N-acetylglucosamine O-acyltransferase [Flavobacterium nitrogenifigens]KAF2325807.1 acyl-ACP--UDP-N-acetylglucosamine O-acyltransferase [Flavobacterium nitrogenifigens]SMO80242.1 acyl-[acyl-carrier-protein]--UDP-N-acetylglucosamine O-acyltransferase [Flavobacterium nitrogenifigens]